VLGPRQVGKTTLAVAEQSGALYLDLEAREKLSDPALFLRAYEDRSSSSTRFTAFPSCSRRCAD